MIVAEASASWLQCSTISEILKRLYYSGRNETIALNAYPNSSRL
jgi:hypothetical protein